MNFAMKVLPSGCSDCVLARKDEQAFGSLGGMSKKGTRPDCECRRQMRSACGAEQMPFIYGGAAKAVQTACLHARMNRHLAA